MLKMMEVEDLHNDNRTLNETIQLFSNVEKPNEKVSQLQHCKDLKENMCKGCLAHEAGLDDVNNRVQSCIGSIEGYYETGLKYVFAILNNMIDMHKIMKVKEYEEIKNALDKVDHLIKISVKNATATEAEATPAAASRQLWLIFGDLKQHFRKLKMEDEKFTEEFTKLSKDLNQMKCNIDIALTNPVATKTESMEGNKKNLQNIVNLILKKKDPDSNYIDLFLNIWNGSGDTIGLIICRVKVAVQFRKLKLSFCEKTNIPLTSLKFLYGGMPIGDEETPEQLGMKNNDVIWVMLGVQGGYSNS